MNFEKSGAMDASKFGRCEYHPKLLYLIFGVFGIVLFGFIGVVSVWLVIENCSGAFDQATALAWAVGIFWSAWVLLALRIVLLYFRGALIIAPTAIAQRGVNDTKSVSIPDVLQVKWRRYSENGSVFIRDAATMITIFLDSYRHADRQEIERFIRSAVPEEKQTGWAELVAHREKVKSRRNPRAKTAVVTKSLIFFAIGCIFITVWAINAAPQFLLAGVVNVLFALLLLWNLRRRREHDAKENTDGPVEAE